MELDAVSEGIPVPLARSFVERPVHCDPGILVVHLDDGLVPLGTSFADKVGAHKLIGLDDLFPKRLSVLLSELLGLFEELLERFLLLMDLAHVDLLVKWPNLVFNFLKCLVGLFN